jgi:hypothetical protein
VAKQKPIILSDESINSYGFRVLTNGIALDDFFKNPIMFYNHDRDLLPIGKWEDIKIENGTLVASPNFDDNDPFAQQIQSKYVQGILNAASMGIDVLDVSEDPSLILAGQRRGTIVKSSIFEASIADIPSNKSCLKLHFKKENITLSGQFPEALLIDNLPLINQIQSMKQIALKLGKPENATEAELVAEVDRLKLQLQGATDAGVKALLAMAEKKGFKKETIEKLAKADFDSALTLVTDAPEKEAEISAEGKPLEQVRLSDLVAELRNGLTPPVEGEKKNFTQMVQTDLPKLKQLYASKPAEVKALYKAQFGAEPTDNDLSKILI